MEGGDARKPDAAPLHEAAQAFVPGVDPGGAEGKEAGDDGKEVARALDMSSRVPPDAARKTKEAKRAFMISVVRVPTDEVSAPPPPPPSLLPSRTA